MDREPETSSVFVAALFEVKIDSGYSKSLFVRAL